MLMQLSDLAFWVIKQHHDIEFVAFWAVAQQYNKQKYITLTVHSTTRKIMHKCYFKIILKADIQRERAHEMEEDLTEVVR
jgi:hypothetical protein